MSDAPNLKKVAALLVVLKEQHEKSVAVIEEINDLLGGGAGIAAQIKEVEQSFARAWSERYNGSYIWRYAVDRPNIKRLIKTLGVVELQVRIFNYIRSDDPFLMRSRHPFGLLVSGINSYAGEGQSPEDFDLAPTVADCHHSPRCASDQEHTRKRTAEMRQ